MTVRFRSAFPEPRVVPWLDYIEVEPGGVITVPDEQWPNWKAGGWEPMDPDPAEKASASPPSSPTPVPTPPAPATPASPSAKPAPAGSDT